jgi:hypothetical protein
MKVIRIHSFIGIYKATLGKRVYWKVFEDESQEQITKQEFNKLRKVIENSQ